MKVTFVYNADIVRVHRAGCRDAKKEARDRRAVTVYDAEVESRLAAAKDFYCDFLSEGSMTEEDALSYTHFLPCVDGLK